MNSVQRLRPSRVAQDARELFLRHLGEFLKGGLHRVDDASVIGLGDARQPSDEIDRRLIERLLWGAGALLPPPRSALAHRRRPLFTVVPVRRF